MKSTARKIFHLALICGMICMPWNILWADDYYFTGEGVNPDLFTDGGSAANEIDGNWLDSNTGVSYGVPGAGDIADLSDVSSVSTGGSSITVGTLNGNNALTISGGGEISTSNLSNTNFQFEGTNLNLTANANNLDLDLEQKSSSTILGNVTGDSLLTIGGQSSLNVTGGITSSDSDDSNVIQISGGSTLTTTSLSEQSGQIEISGGSSLVAGSLALDEGLMVLEGGSTVTIDGGLGTVNLSGGSLAIGSPGQDTAGTLNATAVVFGSQGGSISFYQTDPSYTFSAAISGAAPLLVASSGITELTGANTYTGSTTVQSGTLAIGQGGSIGDSSGVSLTQSGASLDISQGGNQIIKSLKGVAGTGVNLGANTLTLGVEQEFTGTPSTTFGGVISGSGALQLNYAILVLTGANTYTGGSIISPTTILQVGRFGTTGSITGNVAVYSSEYVEGQLEFARSDSIAFSGVISGNGTVSQIGGGTITFTGNNIFTGPTVVNDGILAIGQGGSISSSNSVSVGGETTFDISQGGDQTITDLGGSGTVALGGNELTLGTANSTTFSGAIEDGGLGGGSGGSLNKQGSGTLTLTGANTYTGGTIITAGVLQIGNGATSGSIIGNVNDSGSLAFNRSDDISFDGVVSGEGNLTQTGPGILILTGANTYSGVTTITAGTLALGQGGNIASSSEVNIGSSATFDISQGSEQTIQDLIGSGTVSLGNKELILGTSNNTTFSGVIQDGGLDDGVGGSLNKQGTGTLTLIGANTYTGGTTISGGSCANYHLMGPMVG